MKNLKQKIKNKIRGILFNSILKKSDNYLPFTKREITMIKWFLKFQVMIIVLLVVWFQPAIVINETFTNYQEVLKENTTLKTKEVKAKTVEVEKKINLNNPDEVKNEIKRIAEENNFKWVDYLLRLANCESSFNILARNDNGANGIDRGIFQINNKYHPEVSDECADNILCATEWTMWRINSGHQNEWMCDKIIRNKK